MSTGQKIWPVHFAPKISEWTTALILFFWSTIVLLTIKQEPPSFEMTAYANAHVWATITGLGSFLRLITLYINGALRRSPHLRSGFAFLSCFVWLQIMMSHLNTGVFTTALAVYPVLFLLDFYNAYRIAIEARITDESYSDDRPDINTTPN